MDVIQFLTALLEISFIAVILNYLISFFWKTRAMDLMLGVLIFLVIFLLAGKLKFLVIEQLMSEFVNVAVFALLIIFQPELRYSLSKLNFRGKRYHVTSGFDSFIDGLAVSVYHLSEKKVGALIVLENQDSLDEFVNKSIALNANFTGELLESIFANNTPLHDGAVIMRGNSILSAASILPLAEDTFQVTRSMGTRHRAGLGMSQISDALVIVVSEENGKVSIARDGIMTREVKYDRFKGILRSIFTKPVNTSTTNKKNKLISWFLKLKNG